MINKIKNNRERLKERAATNLSLFATFFRQQIFALVLLILLTFLPFNSLYAELPWLTPEKSFTTAVNVSYDQFDQFLIAGGSKYTLPGEVEQLDIAMLAQYAITDKLMAQINIPLSYSKRNFSYLETDGFGRIIGVGTGDQGQIRDVNNNFGLGDVTLQTKYLVYDGLISLAPKLALKIPGTYTTNQVNAPGDGQTDLGFGFLLGKRISSPVALYAGLDFTFVQRFGLPANQLNLTLETGIFATRYLLFRILYDKVIQFGGENLLFFGLTNNFPALDEDYDKLGGGLGFRANPTIDIFATIFKTIYGNNTSDSLVFTLGVSKTF